MGATARLKMTTPLTEHRLAFDQPEELAVYRQFLTLQATLPLRRSLMVVRGAVRVPGHTFHPDLLVIHRGRAGAVEVDGSSHYGRAAADRSRDRLLEDAGIYYVDHLDAEAASDPGECALFVERFVDRLAG